MDKIRKMVITTMVLAIFFSFTSLGAEYIPLNDGRYMETTTLKIYEAADISITNADTVLDAPHSYTCDGRVYSNAGPIPTNYIISGKDVTGYEVFDASSNTMIGRYAFHQDAPLSEDIPIVGHEVALGKERSLIFHTDTLTSDTLEFIGDKTNYRITLSTVID